MRGKLTSKQSKRVLPGYTKWFQNSRWGWPAGACCRLLARELLQLCLLGSNFAPLRPLPPLRRRQRHGPVPAERGCAVKHELGTKQAHVVCGLT